MDFSYINYFKIVKYEEKNIHIAAPEHIFKNPCIGYILKGKGEFHYKGKIYYAHKNDLIYISRGTRYYSIWTGEPDIEFYSINFSFENLYEKNEYGFQIFKNFPEYNIHEIYEKSFDSPFECIGGFYIFLQKLYSCLIKTQKESSNSPFLPAIKYIEENCTKKIPVQYLASLCGYSQSRFFALFKSTYGCTPIEYKNNILIHKAINILTKTDKTIEETANELEFSSSSYFRKIFKSITGKNPKDIRKAL